MLTFYHPGRDFLIFHLSKTSHSLNLFRDKGLKSLCVCDLSVCQLNDRACDGHRPDEDLDPVAVYLTRGRVYRDVFHGIVI